MGNDFRLTTHQTNGYTVGVWQHHLIPTCLLAERNNHSGFFTKAAGEMWLS